MSRRFITTVIAAALTITALGQTPARADEDLARLLAAVVGVAIVGKVISDRIEDNDQKKRVTQHDSNNGLGPVRAVRPQARAFSRVEPRPLPRRVNRFLLPGDCLRSFQAHDGRYRVFGDRCLQRSYAFSDSLPQACKVKFRAGNQKRQGYDARCLRRSGYQLARG
ncbi:MAG: hypothetical protein V2I76_04995 [Roseobacter sp.]|jgi:hypothetical protein|nr:hypothetical protein [Roseobacter sp.]